jgi:hypothetical protein
MKVIWSINSMAFFIGCISNYRIELVKLGNQTNHLITTAEFLEKVGQHWGELQKPHHHDNLSDFEMHSVPGCFTRALFVPQNLDHRGFKRRPLNGNLVPIHLCYAGIIFLSRAICPRW